MASGSPIDLSNSEILENSLHENNSLEDDRVDLPAVRDDTYMLIESLVEKIAFWRAYITRLTKTGIEKRRNDYKRVEKTLAKLQNDRDTLYNRNKELMAQYRVIPDNIKKEREVLDAMLNNEEIALEHKKQLLKQYHDQIHTNIKMREKNIKKEILDNEDILVPLLQYDENELKDELQTLDNKNPRYREIMQILNELQGIDKLLKRQEQLADYLDVYENEPLRRYERDVAQAQFRMRKIDELTQIDEELRDVKKAKKNLRPSAEKLSREEKKQAKAEIELNSETIADLDKEILVKEAELDEIRYVYPPTVNLEAIEKELVKAKKHKGKILDILNARDRARIDILEPGIVDAIIKDTRTLIRVLEKELVNLRTVAGETSGGYDVHALVKNIQTAYDQSTFYLISDNTFIGEVEKGYFRNKDYRVATIDKNAMTQLLQFLRVNIVVGKDVELYPLIKNLARDGDDYLLPIIQGNGTYCNGMRVFAKGAKKAGNAKGANANVVIEGKQYLRVARNSKAYKEFLTQGAHIKVSLKKGRRNIYMYAPRAQPVAPYKEYGQLLTPEKIIVGNLCDSCLKDGVKENCEACALLQNLASPEHEYREPVILEEMVPSTEVYLPLVDEIVYTARTRMQSDVGNIDKNVLKDIHYIERHEHYLDEFLYVKNGKDYVTARIDENGDIEVFDAFADNWYNWRKYDIENSDVITNDHGYMQLFASRDGSHMHPLADKLCHAFWINDFLKPDSPYEFIPVQDESGHVALVSRLSYRSLISTIFPNSNIIYIAMGGLIMINNDFTTGQISIQQRNEQIMAIIESPQLMQALAPYTNLRRGPGLTIIQQKGLTILEYTNAIIREIKNDAQKTSIDGLSKFLIHESSYAGEASLAQVLNNYKPGGDDMHLMFKHDGTPQWTRDYTLAYKPFLFVQVRYNTNTYIILSKQTLLIVNRMNQHFDMNPMNANMRPKYEGFLYYVNHDLRSDITTEYGLNVDNPVLTDVNYPRLYVMYMVHKKLSKYDPELAQYPKDKEWKEIEQKMPFLNRDVQKFDEIMPSPNLIRDVQKLEKKHVADAVKTIKLDSTLKIGNFVFNS